MSSKAMQLNAETHARIGLDLRDRFCLPKSVSIVAWQGNCEKLQFLYLFSCVVPVENLQR